LTQVPRSTSESFAARSNCPASIAALIATRIASSGPGAVGGTFGTVEAVALETSECS
jgi:hypothetical protein